MEKDVQHNTNGYMQVAYGSSWRCLIDEPEDGSLYFEKLDRHFYDNPEWQEAASSELFWTGTIKLDGKQYYIGGEDNCCDVFLVEMGQNEY